ncbi:MAG: T9SS type A sorting domain-containing protein, partial [Saprospiraceae bacterium]|nr:T9SS type A sorting domain-containing protein [Saprospiraceae bacterium]
LSTAGFQDIVSMQFSINYDPDQISFIGMQELNLPGLHPSNIGNPAPGNITLSWVCDDVTSGYSLPDGSIICRFGFHISDTLSDKTALTFSDYPTSVEISDTEGYFTPVFHNGSIRVSSGLSPLAIYRNCDTLGLCNQITPPSVIPGFAVTNGEPPYSYVWSKNGFFFSNEENPALDELGHYEMFVYDQIGIFASAEIDVVEELFNPSVNFVLCSIYGQETGVIYLNVDNGMPPYDIEWSNGLTADEITGLAPGFYSVTIEDASHCSTSFNQIEVCEMPQLVGDIPAGLNIPDEINFDGLLQDSDKLLIWPNPATSEINLQNTEGILEVRVHDQYGTIRGHYILDGNQGFRLDVSAFPTGYYWLQVQYETGIIQKTILKI